MSTCVRRFRETPPGACDRPLALTPRAPPAPSCRSVQRSDYRVGLFVGGALLGAALVGIMVLRETVVSFWTGQRTWPLVGSTMTFHAQPQTSIAVAQSFVDRHAATCGLQRPDLQDLALISQIKGLMGETLLCMSGDYVVARYVKRVFPGCDCMSTDFNYIFPKADITFMSCARTGRNILYLIFFLGACAGLAAAVDKDKMQVGALVGGIIGLIVYMGSHRQSITFGLNNNQLVTVSVPGSQDLRGTALDILRGAFPPTMQDQLRNDTPQVDAFTGYTPSSMALPRSNNPLMFVFKYIYFVFSSIVMALFMFFSCSWIFRLMKPKGYKPRGRTAAFLRLYQHHVETHTAPVARCLCLSVAEGPLHKLISNLFAYGEDTYISVLHNTSVVTSRKPGIRDSIYFFIWAVLWSGFFYQLNKLASLVVLIIFVFTGLMLFITRSTYVYIGDNERNAFIDVIGREGHHVEFEALDEEPTELVSRVATARRASINTIRSHGGYIAHRHIAPQV